MDSKIIFFSITLLLSSAAAIDITTILSQYTSFSTFNSYLIQTGVADVINSRQPPVTVLVVDNSNIAPLLGKSPEVLKKIMSAHVILDYYDGQKLKNLQDKSVLATTLFQTTGQAVNNQGYLNITDLGNGKVAFGSGASGAILGTDFVKVVETQPYDLAIVQISSVIVPPGIDSSPSTNSSSGDSTSSSTKPPSPSPSPNPTQTKTSTASPTPTQTNTSTASPTQTQTNTSTASPTPTQTNTSTASPTPTQTNTTTASPTPTQTNTTTASPTQSPTQSPTNTSTASPAKSPVASPTKAPTASPTKTPTASPTKNMPPAPSPRKMLSPTTSASLPAPSESNTPTSAPDSPPTSLAGKTSPTANAPTQDDDATSSVGSGLRVSAGIIAAIVSLNLFLVLMA